MSLLPVGFGSQGEYTIEESLRFNSSQSSYLSWTPASAGNRKTWTWSGWVKRGQLGTDQEIMAAGPASNNLSQIRFNTNDSLVVDNSISGTNSGTKATSAVFRDVSAWYHIVVAIDTTQATASNRYRVYVNGVDQGNLSGGTEFVLNSNTSFSNTEIHNIGRRVVVNDRYFDGYITEVNFIDGQALDPSSFGEFDSVTGVWKPAKYTGTYGTNGFYLPMQLDNTVEGFNTVTYIGTQKPQKISGVGFSPDLVWIKSRNNAQNHTLYDSVRGATKYLMSNSTNAEATDAQTLTSFDTDGFSMGTSFPNDLNYTYVAWCWDAGASTVSNTDGSITSSVRANPTYGFSVVTYTGNGTDGATVGHGLNSAPEFSIIKNRGTATNWDVTFEGISGGTSLNLDTTSAVFSPALGYHQLGATTLTLKNGGSGIERVNTNTQDYIAYCFHSVAGFSKFGSYTGTGASGNTVTTGFKPAFVMIKRTDTTGGWSLFDNTRDPVNPIDVRLQANVSDAENSGSTIEINFNADGFEIDGTASSINASGGTYIYMAFADTREYAYWLDDSGNNNDWQPNGGITTESTVTDTPTPYADGGNYCVLSPIDTTTNIIADLSNGNLKFEGSTSNSRTTWGTFTVNSQKWYFEVSIDFSAAAGSRVGLRGANSGICYRADGQKLENNTSTSYGATWAAGDLIGVAFDCDAQTIEFFKNNVSQGSFSYTNSVDSSNEVKAEVADGSAGNPLDGTVNFGQRPFAYTPPTGFLPLHTGNLPDSAVVDGSQYFDAVLYTGDSSNGRTITGLEFQPDFVWIKDRSVARSNYLQNVVTGAGKELISNSTAAESTSTNKVVSFDSGGFTLNDSASVNGTGESFVAWNWKANGAGVSNTDGSITSTVSANPTAGVSVVTWSGNGVDSSTVGHSLGVKPSMVIAKSRSVAGDWRVWHQNLSGAGYYLTLNQTAAQGNSTSVWGTSPNQNSTTFTIGTNSDVNTNGATYVAYCFADVEGFSKFGSYTGNGSSDGVFVYLGFRPAFVMWKRTDNIGRWVMEDTSRDTYNVADKHLAANLSNAEGTVTWFTDFLSNGFKVRNSDSESNASGGTYIYMAFAENPFKNSLAR